MTNNQSIVFSLFAQALTTTLHWFLSGLFGMIYEHISKCFISKDPPLRFPELFQTIVVVVHGDILKSMALALGVNKLLAMAKDTSGLHFIVVSKVFF
jgi:hypothetical protein